MQDSRQNMIEDLKSYLRRVHPSRRELDSKQMTVGDWKPEDFKPYYIMTINLI